MCLGTKYLHNPGYLFYGFFFFFFVFNSEARIWKKPPKLVTFINSCAWVPSFYIIEIENPCNRTHMETAQFLVPATSSLHILFHMLAFHWMMKTLISWHLGWETDFYNANIKVMILQAFMDMSSVKYGFYTSLNCLGAYWLPFCLFQWQAAGIIFL